jgi:hypothetical protein
MTRVHDVKLELVRPGPPHNQLLSPLTPYMALCGDGSPVTFHIEFEHRQLLNRLEGLRYFSEEQEGAIAAIPNRVREAQVLELGEEMGRLLSGIPSLNAELARARAGGDRGSEFVNLRLVLSGSELAILPFELARAPQAYPGEGLDLCLQGSLPIVVTREIRRSRSRRVSWLVAKPKVLFVCAEPGGLTVPKREHVRALRDALDPWIKWPSDGVGDSDQAADGTARLPHLKECLRVLSAASIEDIYEMCSQEAFTHVHILAHGDTYKEAGEDRFGVALHRHRGSRDKKVVGGKQLAQALRAEGVAGSSRSEPLVVTLAICDAGSQGSVLVPGGSIAHDLHTEGVPWVFASQFPLTKRGSVRIAEFLYPRLMRGDDPRQILYELRRTLSMKAAGEHDWASIVTYASVEESLDQDVAEFFAQQTISAIEVLMAKVDHLVVARAADLKVPPRSIKQTLQKVEELLQRWQTRLPSGSSVQDRTTRTNCYGMQGSTFKRIGLLNAAIDQPAHAFDALQQAWVAYRRAMAEWVTDGARFNWTASQYLALNAVLEKKERDVDVGTYGVCRRLAERDLDSPDQEIKAWAHATLAELELVGSFYGQSTVHVKASVVEHCEGIVSLMGYQSFHVTSTRRQFQRYAEEWQLSAKWPHKEWTDIAKAAVKALTPQS